MIMSWHELKDHLQTQTLAYKQDMELWSDPMTTPSDVTDDNYILHRKSNDLHNIMREKQPILVCLPVSKPTYKYYKHLLNITLKKKEKANSNFCFGHFNFVQILFHQLHMYTESTPPPPPHIPLVRMKFLSDNFFPRTDTLCKRFLNLFKSQVNYSVLHILLICTSYHLPFIRYNNLIQ